MLSFIIVMTNINDIYNRIIDQKTGIHFNIDVDNLSYLTAKVTKIIKNNSTIKINELDNIFYVVHISRNDDTKIKLFLVYCLLYYSDNMNKQNNKMIVGIDFEFTKTKIGLCQLSFHPAKKSKYIFILNPTILSTIQKELFIKTIFISPIYRIIHGGDTLDIPFIYEDLFMQNTEYMEKFLNGLYDTRYLCEYIKIYDNYVDKKCSIYNALLYFNVVDIEKFNELEEINKQINYRKFTWEELTLNMLKYVLYDVLFLKKFVKNLFSYAQSKNKQLYHELKIIPMIDKYNYLQKYGINDSLSYVKELIDPLNNMSVELYNIKKPMVSFYDDIINETDDKMKQISNILKINNFKKSMTILFKFIVFDVIISEINDDNILIKNFTNIRKKLSTDLKYFKLNDILEMLNNFHEFTKIIIVNLFYNT